MKAKYDRDVWTLPDDVKAKRKQEEEERLATSAFMMHFKNKTAFVGKDGTNAQLINVNALTRSKGQMITSNNNYSSSFVDSNHIAHHAASETTPEITSNTNKSENNMYNKANLSQGNSRKSYGIVAPGEHNARRKAALRSTTNQTNNCHENINNVITHTAPLNDDKDSKWEDRTEQLSQEEEELLSKEREGDTMMYEENLHNVTKASEESLSIPSPFATATTAENNKKQQILRLPLLPYHLVHDVHKKVQVQSLKRMTPSHIESKSDNKEYHVSGSNARVGTVGQELNLEHQNEAQEEEYQTEEKEESCEEEYERLFSAKPSCATHENIEHVSHQRHSLSFQPTGLLWKDAFAHEDDETEEESNNNNNIIVQRQKREKEPRRPLQKQRSTESAPLRLQSSKVSPINIKNKIMKDDKKSNTKSNKTKMSNANNAKETEPASHHTPNSKVIYTPYSLEDYKAMMNKIANTKFGGLGPSDSDEQRRARERKLREREYGMQAERQAAAALALQVQSRKDTNTNQEVHSQEQLELEQPKQEEHQNSNDSKTNKHISGTTDGNLPNKEENNVENNASERVICKQSRELLEKNEKKNEDHEQEVELEHHNVEEKTINKTHLRQPTPKQVIAARKRRERALQYGLQAASNLQKRHELFNNNCNNNDHDNNNTDETCAGGVTQQADKRVKDADVIAAEKRALLLADLESEHEQKKNAIEMIRRQLRA